MKKSKLILSICLLMSLVIIPGCKEASKPKKEDFKYSYNRTLSSSRPAFVDNNNNTNIFYGIDSSMMVLPGKWYTTINRHYIEKSNIEYKFNNPLSISIKQWKKYNINFYDINTNKKIKTIDALKEFNKHVDTKQYQLIGFEYILKIIGDKTYILLLVEKIPSKEELKKTEYDLSSSWKYAFYLSADGGESYLSQEKVSYSSENFSYADFDEQPDKQVLYGTDILGKNYPLYSNETSPDDGEETSSKMLTCSVYKLDTVDSKSYSNYSLFSFEGYYPDPRECNLNIYNKYPELKKYMINEFKKGDKKDFKEFTSKTTGKKVKCIDYQNRYVNYQKIYIYAQGSTWKDMVKLFMLEGQEISYQNIVLSKYWTDDGKEHVVNSEAEAKQYIKDYPSDN